METTVQLYSQELSPSGLQDPFTISVEESLWRMRFDGEHTEGRFFLQIATQDDTKQWIAPVGDVLYTKMFAEEERISEHHYAYMPLWMLDSAGFQGYGEVLKCSLLSNDNFPEATKIVLRVIDSAFYTENLKEELEVALTKLGVLQKHTTIQIPIPSLGDYPVELFVSDLEPANCVLCDGDEVIVEFEEPIDQISAPAPVSAPIPRPPTPIPNDPDMLQAMIVPELEQRPHGFVPFQGEGYRLDGVNPNVPEWRKNLPPPRRP